MTQVVGRNSTIVIWDNSGTCQNISGDMNNVVLTFQKDNPESTTFGKDTKQKLSSLRDTTLVCSGIWNGGGSLVDKTLSGISSASQNTLVKFMPDGSSLNGNVYSACMQLQSYAVTGPLNGAAMISYTFLGSSGSVSSPTQYQKKILSLFGSSIIAYWPLDELSGTVSNDISDRNHSGIYSAITLGASGIGDGATSASLNGTTSFDNIYSTGLSADFNGAEGTLAIWAKVDSAGVWTDGVGRTASLLLNSPSNDFISIQRTTTNNELALWRFATSSKQILVTISSTAWLHLALTWSVAADQLIAYVNGVAQGSPTTGLGSLTGTLESTRTLVGAGSQGGGGVWSGVLAHAVLLNRPATSTEILKMATV